MPGPGRLRGGPRWGRLVAAGSAAAVTLVTLLGGIGVLPEGTPAAAASNGSAQSATLSDATVQVQAPSAWPRIDPAPAALPSASGSGKRVVFDISDQRVWLVGVDGRVLRSYLVSGSVTDNLAPGTFAVYSRSRHAVGIDDSGTMEFFVRFARGANAAIGFHSLPVKDGHAVQTVAQLGTPQSHGCIRQARPDARTLWRFAPVGTQVVVTA